MYVPKKPDLINICPFFLAPPLVTPRRARARAARSDVIYPFLASSDRLNLNPARGC